MLALDINNISQERIGEAHGVNLPTAFRDYSTICSEMITALWEKHDQPNQWCRWLDLGNNTALVEQINTYAQEIHGQFEHLVIIGIGGSSLGGIALFEALLPSYWNERSTEQRQGHPRYYFIDNVDSDKLHGLLAVLDLKKTLVNVITKSGTTAETMAGYLWLKLALEKAVGKENLSKHLVMTTDPAKGVLRKIVADEGLTAFEVPEDVGGRFSVFSAVGLLPAAILGIEIAEMLRGIRDLAPVLQSNKLEQNPAAQGALMQYLLYQRGKHLSVFMPYSAKLAYVADWTVQLWAESLGKKTNLDQRVVHEGLTPIKAVGVTDQHSQVQLFNEGPFDKVFTFVRLGKFNYSITIPNLYPDVPDLSYLGNQTFETLLQAEGDATRASLTKNQRPNMTITLPQLDAYHLGQLLYFLEVQTALMGSLLHIDPFDQPGVELAKQYTYALMGRPGFESLKSEASGTPFTHCQS
jgi:glucose-6-phosphate isomerase